MGAVGKVAEGGLPWALPGLQGLLTHLLGLPRGLVQGMIMTCVAFVGCQWVSRMAGSARVSALGWPCVGCQVGCDLCNSRKSLLGGTQGMSFGVPLRVLHMKGPTCYSRMGLGMRFHGVEFPGAG